MPVIPRAAALAAVLALGLGACTSQDDSPASPSAGDPPLSSAPTSASTEEPSPETTAPTTAGTPTAAAPTTLAARLLAASAVPGLNATWHWRDGKTSRAGTKPFGPCARFDLASIGATEVVQKTFFPPVDTDDNAAEQVAELPDAKSVAQAAAVLRSWYSGCPTKIAGGSARKGPLTRVSAGAGTGSWYLVTVTVPGSEEGRFIAVGTAVVGTRIAVLTMTSGGQDYSYPPGKEPMVGMVQAAAASLG